MTTHSPTLESQMAADQRLNAQAAHSLEQEKKEQKEFGQQVKENHTSLGVSYELDDTLWAVRSFMVAPAMYKGRRLPRYGMMSHMLAATPCHLYDNPVMNNITKTAFTDGISIYIHAGFWEKLIDEQNESMGQKMGPVQIILHELSHKLLRHVFRHMRYDRSVANQGQDKVINARLQAAYPEMDWADTLKETGLGFGTEEQAKYVGMTEEAAMREILDQRQKGVKQAPGQKGKGGKGGQGGQGGQGGSGQSSGSPSDGASGGGSGGASDDDWDEPEEGQGMGQDDGVERDERFGGEDDEHTITPEDLAQRMKEGGMDQSMHNLGIPDPTDKAAHQKKQQTADLQRVDAINKAVSEMERSKGQYPGADMVTYCADVLRADAKGKLRWKLEFRVATMTAKRESKYVEDDEPNEIYHVDEVTEILGQELYTGVHIQHSKASVVLFMIDISGSMGNPDVKAALTEAFALKRAANNFSDTASEVLILQCDTHVKESHLIELNEDNANRIFAEGVVRPSNGGTDLGQSLREAFQLKKVRDKDVRAVVFVTDTYDRAPKLKELGIPRGQKPVILYAVVPSSGLARAEEFARQLDHGRVVYIDDQAEADLTAQYMDKMDASPTVRHNRRRARS